MATILTITIMIMMVKIAKQTSMFSETCSYHHVIYDIETPTLYVSVVYIGVIKVLPIHIDGVHQPCQLPYIHVLGTLFPTLCDMPGGKGLQDLPEKHPYAILNHCKM